ncbi:sulfotransferase [Cocleimonas sp. KMM 6892]|uniref:sulfotransferase n=1 Tax=unclassified Cocleimonas TaxID=2639732 RepID=UPI002DC05886|nr:MULTISPECIES: sulfotransferase [unclassified Cocleimonas]MEB8430925.1 sulfotransferase [Cocleimonas sp. KMM 6892]MEC4714303.1 sulfotransferase [Cocleimonas sp. KMM 6895]MEC4743634.1 sulfotransferase [Cocleimonas sp. KMM 6896]
MDTIKNLKSQISPVAIGGVGGSGTRLIANCLEELNYYIGSDLNKAKDNLWFTLLFKHIEILDYDDDNFNYLLNIFLQGMLTKEQLTEQQKHTVDQLIHEQRHLPIAFFKDRAESLLSSHKNTLDTHKWGWKEPNTHIILDRLTKYLPKMKYIHVMRNGLDMAHSNNQNQQLLWGKKFIGDDFKQTPYYSLKYWCTVHKRLLDIAENMENNFLLINYDNFCTNPEIEVPKFLNFLNVPIDDSTLTTIQSLIRAPASIGRYKEYGTSLFDQADLEFVKKLGFNT